MARSLLIRGMLVGLLAGLLMFAVGRIVGEPQVDRAIAFETALDAATMKAEAAAHPDRPAPQPEPELVSRPNQAGPGLLTGTVIYGTAFGGLFALVFAYAYGRIGTSHARGVSALLATFGLLGLYVIPSLKYPASPPAVGDPDTIGSRTLLYFTMFAISLAGMIGGLVARQRLAARFGGWNASLIAIGGYVIVVGIVMLVLPTVQEVPEGFPAVVLWNFRIASLAMQTTLWATLGLVFGSLTEMSLVNRWSNAPGRRPSTLVR